MKRKKLQVILILILGGFMTFSGCDGKSQTELFDAREEETAQSGEEAIEETDSEEEQTEEVQTESMIYVQVCGAVNHPGVVTLPAGSRAFEAIALAGGLTGEAAESSVNQAQVLTDGQQLIVWTKEEVRRGAATAQGQGEDGILEQAVEKINLNTATAQELMTLSGIGESRAADIIAYREENGGFQSIEDIMKVSGIKEATFEKIKDQITVS